VTEPVPALVHGIGAVAAALTTLCWLPQAVRVIRLKDTRAISLTTNLVFATGILLWLIYGIAIGNGPLIAANAVSLILTLVIVAMKLRYG
jgi:MtN3 and saliva related transmembrane protein